MVKVTIEFVNFCAFVIARARENVYTALSLGLRHVKISTNKFTSSASSSAEYMKP